MSEIIRYSWGKSSLGDFIVATSDKGVVVFEFAHTGNCAECEIGDLVPDATLVRDDEGLAGLVDKLTAIVEHPDQDSNIPLDPRGSDFEKRVWTLLRDVPAGYTTNYGQISTMAGTGNDAREVTKAISANRIAILIPCHRILKKDGSISGYRWGVSRKRELLKREENAGEFVFV